MVVATQKRKMPVSRKVQKRDARFSSGGRMAVVPTGWGLCGIVWRNQESESSNRAFAEKPPALLCRILTPGLSQIELRAQLLRLHPGCHEIIPQGGHGANAATFHPETVPDWFGGLVRFLEAYYTDGLRAWTEPKVVEHWSYWRPRLDWSQLTEFQRRTLEVVAGIGCGLQWTYGQVAARIGKPSACRAVGAAIGNNPWPVLVPCHRVVGGNGKLTGFSAPGGVATKRRMLELEESQDLWETRRA